MRWKSIVSLALAAMFTACATDPVAPTVDRGFSLDQVKVSVCHVNGTGSYRLISIAGPALAAHIAHGDAVPGDPVPGVPRKKFTDACAIVNADPNFFTFYIRNNNGTIAPPWDTDMVLSENAAGDGYTFATPRGGQKVGYGTTFFDGIQLNTLESVNWTAVSGMNGGIITYLNIWVTDGAGNYAVIASENQYPGTNFLTRTEWKVFEFGPTTNLDWLFSTGSATRVNQYILRNGVNATLADFGNNIVIGSPTNFGLVGIGTGAPRGGFGLNLIWGDTQSNFTQPVIGQIANLTIKVAGLTFNASN